MHSHKCFRREIYFGKRGAETGALPLDALENRDIDTTPMNLRLCIASFLL